MAHIFISFKSSDDSYRHGLEGLLQNPNNHFHHVPVAAREDRRQYGEAAVRRYLKDQVRGCDLVVCLMGPHTSDSDWVDYELQVAKSLGIRIVAVAIPGRRGPGLRPRPIANQTVHPWDRLEVVVGNALNGWL